MPANGSLVIGPSSPSAGAHHENNRETGALRRPVGTSFPYWRGRLTPASGQTVLGVWLEVDQRRHSGANKS